MLHMNMASLIGRDYDMQELSAQVMRDRCVVLWGPNGIGKTMLARAFGRRQIERNVWPDGVTWVSLRNLGTSVDARIRIVLALGLDPGAAQHDRTLVRAIGNKHALVLLDELDRLLQKDGPATLDLLRSLLDCRRLHLVMTSEQAVPGFASLLVAGLQAEDAKHTFLSYAPSRNEQQGNVWRSLLRVLDGHPYLIRLAASHLEQTQAGLALLLQSLQPGVDPTPQRTNGRFGGLLQHVRESFGPAYGKPDPEQTKRALATMLDLSFAALPPDAQDVCGLLSLFPAGLSEAAVDFLLGEAGVQALPVLVRFGLAEHETDYDGGRFVLAGAARAHVQGYQQAKAWKLVGPRALQFFHALTHQVHHQIVGGQRIEGGLLLSLEQPNLDQVLHWGYLHEQPSEAKSLSARATALLHNYWKLTMTLASVPLRQLEAALQAARRVGDHTGIARLLHIMADVHALRGASDVALQHYQQALASFVQSDMPDGATSVHYDLGCFYAKQHNHAAALASFDQAFGLYRIEGDQLGAARTCIKRAESLEAIGDRAGARASLEQALALGIAEHDHNDAASVYFLLGKQDAEEEAYAAALARYEQARATYAAAGDPHMAAYMLRSVGDVERAMGADDAAIAHFSAALQLFEQFEDHQGLSQVHHRIGEIHMAHADYGGALASYVQALDHFQALGSVWGEALTYASMGRAYQRRENMTLAAESYGLALNLYREQEDKYGEASTCVALGDLLHEQDDPANALKMYEHAASLYHYLGLGDEAANVLARQGEVKVKSGKLKGAHEGRGTS